MAHPDHNQGPLCLRREAALCRQRHLRQTPEKQPRINRTRSNLQLILIYISSLFNSIAPAFHAYTEGLVELLKCPCLGLLSLLLPGCLVLPRLHAADHGPSYSTDGSAFPASPAIAPIASPPTAPTAAPFTRSPPPTAGPES